MRYRADWPLVRQAQPERYFPVYSEVDLLRKMLQKQPELRISAAEALKHPYFTDSDDKIYVPKILMKQSGSCPVELISN